MPQRKSLRFSSLSFLVLGMVQNEKHGVENLGKIFSEVSETSEFSTSSCLNKDSFKLFLNYFLKHLGSFFANVCVAV